ncbi:MAG: LptF/LptG family permease, partial [Mycobacteriales bacterium]
LFAILMARSGAFVGVLLSIVLVLVYYTAYVVCTSIVGRNGWLPPMAAAWLPDVIFLLLGLWALRRVE